MLVSLISPHCVGSIGIASNVLVSLILRQCVGSIGIASKVLVILILPQCAGIIDTDDLRMLAVCSLQCHP